jgi:hypothetical protein
MASSTIHPITDVTTTNFTNVGGAASFSAALSDGLDTTYAQTGSSTATLALDLSSLPTLSLVTAVAILLRIVTSSTKSSPTLTAYIGNSTHATTGSATFSPTTSTTNNSQTPSLLFTGTTDWNTALGISISVSNSGNDTLKVFECSVTVTYNTASGQPVERRFQGVPNAAFHGMPGLGSSSPSSLWLPNHDLIVPRRKLILPIRRAA